MTSTPDNTNMRFRRDAAGDWSHVELAVNDPIAALNIANRHFGNPDKNIGGPRLPTLERWTKE